MTAPDTDTLAWLHKRLKAVVPYQGKSEVAFLCHEAADALDALRAERDALKAALDESQTAEEGALRLLTQAIGDRVQALKDLAASRAGEDALAEALKVAVATFKTYDRFHVDVVAMRGMETALAAYAARRG